MLQLCCIASSSSWCSTKPLALQSRVESPSAAHSAPRLSGFRLGGEFELNSPFGGRSLVSSFLGCALVCGSAPKLRSARKSNAGGWVAPRAVLEVNTSALVQWCARMFVYYVLLKIGITGKKLDDESSGSELPFVKQIRTFLLGSDGSSSKPAKSLTSKWHENTKGALVRKTLVPSKTEGKRLLRDISVLLSEDDLFRDASSHKGCQIRRESAHGESVCCNNVRALFDELPTPRIMVEITVFPPGPITAAEFEKAAKLESVLRKGNSI